MSQHGMCMFRIHVFWPVKDFMWNLIAAHHAHMSIGSIEEHTSDVKTEATAANTLRLSKVADWEPWQQQRQLHLWRRSRCSSSNSNMIKLSLHTDSQHNICCSSVLTVPDRKATSLMFRTALIKFYCLAAYDYVRWLKHVCFVLQHLHVLQRSLHDFI